MKLYRGLFILLFTLLLSGFSSDTQVKKSYKETVRMVLKVRDSMKAAKHKGTLNLKEAEAKFAQLMVKEIFPYWHGTPWDFNGYTDTPGKGVIACGYFVSTSLKHAGCNLNRYRMAQKASLGILKMVCDSQYNKFNQKDSFINFMKQKAEPGLYVLALSYHVGFVYKSESELKFIHSNYNGAVGVMEEDLDKSAAIDQSYLWIAGTLSGNENFMKKWLDKTNFPHK